MEISPDEVAAERRRLERSAARYVRLINDTRDRLGTHFDQEVGHVSEAAFREAVAELFADGDRAVNVTALIGILRTLDVTDDYPGFVVDELLGRQLAATIAGGEPQATLAEATFHFIDISHDRRGEPAGVDDLDAGVAAGFQTRLPGWPWQATDSPFAPSG